MSRLPFRSPADARPNALARTGRAGSPPETSFDRLARLALCLESAGQGFWDCSLRSEEAYFSPTCWEMLGYRPEECEPTWSAWSALVHPEDLPDVRALIEAHVSGELPACEAEYRMRTRAGEWMWVQSRGSVAQRSADGRPLRIAGTLSDISARKHMERTLLRSREQTASLLESITDGISTDFRGVPCRNEMEEALRESEERFRQLAASIDEVFWLASPGDRRLLYVSPAFERIWGRPLPSPGTDATLTLPSVHEEDRRAFREAHAAAERGAETAVEHRFFRPDGEMRFALSRIFPVRVAAGRIHRIAGITRDVTEQHRADETLRKRERYFRSLIENSSDVISILSGDGELLYVSPSVERSIGWRPEELVGTNAFDLIHPDDLAVVREVFKRARADPQAPLLVAYRIRDRAGIWRSVEATASNRLGDPAVRGVVLHSRDVTERLRAEAQIRFSSHLLDAVGEAVIATDLDRRVLYWNGFAETLFGWTRGEMVGRSLFDFIENAQDLREHPEVVERLRANSSSSADFAVKDRCGRTFPVQVTHFPIFDEDRELVGVASVYSDLSQRKALEEQLRQAQRLEAVGRLAGGIAHDFNNLLTVIGGFSALLEAEIPPESRGREFLEEIKGAAERSAQLTRQLLAFSRKQILKSESLDLNQVVSSVERMLRRLIGEDVEVVTELGPDAGPVLADRGQIEQVLMNLAVNARDAMQQGGTITVSTAPATITPEWAAGYPYRVVPGEYVRLSVRDTGSGMPDEVLAHLFEPFFTTKEPGKGTGLGLSTVYGIVKQSGGYVWVRSAVGEGTVFDIFLPRHHGAVEAPPREEKRPAPRPGPRSGTVLLVEDERVVRELAGEVLRGGGYRVLSARGAEEALLLAESLSGRIDLLLVDVVMPRMGGRELAEAVRALLSDVAVLYMSGYTDDDVLRYGVSRQECELLHKPFTPGDLLAKVREVLEGRNG